jgi:hypothetical protein
MDAGAALVADGETAKPVEPRQRAFDDPAGPAQATAVRCAALRELRGDPPALELVAMGLRVVAAVALHQLRLGDRTSGTASQRGKCVDEGQELRDVVAIGGRQDRDERNPVRVGENMMLRPGLAAIGRVRSSFFPPRSARKDALSTTARATSSSPRRRSSVRSTAWSRFHTPARCQRTSRRQQVVPEPQPISRGSMFHGSPLRSTKMMPVSTARSGIGARPAYRRFRGRRFGSRGSIRFHNASSIKVFGIA